MRFEVIIKTSKIHFQTTGFHTLIERGSLTFVLEVQGHLDSNFNP